jgi:hypothetical protein
MPSLSEIEALLRDKNSGLAEKITRNIGTFMVALFGVYGSGASERLKFAGTGTLVTIDGSKCILTAAHVWEPFVRDKARGLGITLKENDDHSFFIGIETIVASGPAKISEGWTKWGPDIVFLRIPPEVLGRIEAVKSFVNLTMKEAGPPNVDSLENWVLMGAPEVQGIFSPTHASLAMNAIFATILRFHTHGDFDYVDLDMDLSFPGIPEKFNGVSGGGLWSVLMFGLPNGGVDWNLKLVGVAFFELVGEGNRSVVRCHGEQSIRIALSSVARGGGKS